MVDSASKKRGVFVEGMEVGEGASENRTKKGSDPVFYAHEDGRGEIGQ